MAKKADAWKEYKEAATLDMVLEALPKVINLNILWETETHRNQLQTLADFRLRRRLQRRSARPRRSPWWRTRPEKWAHPGKLKIIFPKKNI